MQEVVRGIIGRELTKSLLGMIKEFQKLKYDDEEIYRNVKKLDDLSIMSLYLLATDFKDNTAFYIKKSYDKVLKNRVKKFREAVILETGDVFLKKLSKTEVINLAYYMNLYELNSKEYNKLSDKDKNCYKILNNYINSMI